MNDNTAMSELKSAIESLERSQSDVMAAFAKAEASDFAAENEKLHSETERLGLELTESQKRLAAAKSDIVLLEKNLRDEINLRRSAVVNRFDKQAKTRIYTALSHEKLKIAELKTKIDAELNKVRGELNRLDAEEANELSEQYHAITSKIHKAYEDAQKENTAIADAMYSNQSAVIKSLMNDETSLEASALRTARKFFNWDTFIGLKIISALGVLLVLFGAFTGASYVYLNMTPQIKCVMLFVLGIAMTGGGEILNRKWRGVFSLTLTAGGIAMLFIADGLGYFVLDTLPMIPAIGICAAIAALGFWLSRRYNSQVIALFALIGGYLPLLALDLPSNFIDWNMIGFAFVYFTVLNIFAFTFSIRRNWRVAQFFRLFAGLAADIAFYYITDNYNGADSVRITSLAFVAVGFLVYQLIPVINANLSKRQTKASDVILLSVNTLARFFIANGIIYSAYYGAKNTIESYSYIIPIFFAVVCIIMAVLTNTGKVTAAKPLKALFFIASVAFGAVTIPYLLDVEWFSLGWVVEATGLLVYGIVTERKRFTISGWIIGALSVAMLIFGNVIGSIFNSDTYFVWKYLAVTLGGISVLGAIAYKKRVQKMGIFTFAVIVNAYFYVVYLFHHIYTVLPNADASTGALLTLAAVIFGMLYSYAVPKLKPLRCYATAIAGSFCGIVSTVRMWVFNASSESDVLSKLSGGGSTVIVFILYLAANIIAVLWVWDLCRYLTSRKKLPIRWYTIAVSGYFVLLLCENLLAQTGLSWNSIVFTLIFAMCGLGWTLYGFRKSNIVLRRGGLGLSIFAAVKLFIADISVLGVGERIVSYLALGAVLLGISLIYQHFEKKQSASDKNNPPA
ncbi:MAG: DUF2339 domain-containing protein [Oscillospiraceae bacterium]|jgi:uncharacterized membrane protein|nr:DUF2339 domain-containing protein [Oscillospiraceae bacterium]